MNDDKFKKCKTYMKQWFECYVASTNGIPPTVEQFQAQKDKFYKRHRTYYLPYTKNNWKVANRRDNLRDFLDSNTAKQMKHDDPHLFHQIVREIRGKKEGGYKI